jgi:hypothetical protein
MFKNKHFNAIITKFFLFVTVLGLFLPAAGRIMTSTAVVAALVATIITYVIADLLVFPLYGNRAAVAVDGLLTVMVTWETAWVLEDIHVPFLGLILLALLVGLGEWYYHRYLARLIFRGKMKP